MYKQQVFFLSKLVSRVAVRRFELYKKLKHINIRSGGKRSCLEFSLCAAFFLVEEMEANVT